MWIFLLCHIWDAERLRYTECIYCFGLDHHPHTCIFCLQFSLTVYLHKKDSSIGWKSMCKMKHSSCRMRNYFHNWSGLLNNQHRKNDFSSQEGVWIRASSFFLFWSSWSLPFSERSSAQTFSNKGYFESTSSFLSQLTEFPRIWGAVSERRLVPLAWHCHLFLVPFDFWEKKVPALKSWSLRRW